MPKYRLLTPGPVAVPERVRLAMAQTLLHHRAPAFIPVFAEVRENLRKIFQTEQDVLILTSTGTGAMEAAVSNVFSPGDQAVVVRGGKFGERWGELCETYDVQAEYVDVEWGQAVNPQAVRSAFERLPDARALLVQASETSTGVYHPIRELAELVHEKTGRLIVVDGISGVGVHDLRTDEWGLDVVVSGSQKSWLLPPGLGFISLSEQARAAVQDSTMKRYYFDLRKEIKAQPGDQTTWTSAVSLIVGLREALRMILEEGLQSVFARHEVLAKVTRGGIQAIGLELLAADSPAFSCTAVKVPEGVDGKAFVKQLRDQYDITVAGGQGHLTGKIFRIGHMGDVDGFDMLSAIAAVEMALADVGFPVKIGEGSRAATELLRQLSAPEA
ncbi:MAG: alanine--glyoxylate aminotransferase family protein [bacterium]|nr:alanine--glyoxylate aminotransferase family protein [bacterium]